MKNKKLIVGIAAGAALLSVAFYLSRNGRYRSLTNSAGAMLDRMKNRISGEDHESETTDHGGSRLANKARKKAEHLMAMNKNGHH